MVSAGYWREGAIVPLSPGGWYHTGDLMRRGEGDDLTPLDEIRSFALAELADYKVPERWLIVSAVPRNTLGKIDRRAAAALIERADEELQFAS